MEASAGLNLPSAPPTRRRWWLKSASPANADLAPKLTDRDLTRWRLVRDFQERLDQAARQGKLRATWSDPQRLCALSDYLSLFLLGLLNPVVRTMRGLCEASQLPRVQTDICHRPISLGSFSEAQRVVDLPLLERVFGELAAELPSDPTAHPRLQNLAWMARDGSLWSALPRMHWALSGSGRGGRSHGVKLHLSLHLLADKPARAQVRPGRQCERAVWEQDWQAGDAYVGDRYFGENYRLLTRLEDKHCVYVLRLREQAIITVEEELPVSVDERAAGVVRQAWVRLGKDPKKQSGRVRVVWLETAHTQLILVTNVKPEELSADLIALLYRKRWQVELFFRWVKCILGCRHWLAESEAGVTIQIYLALIAALLLQLYTGRRPSKRVMELIQFYLLGVATLDDLWAGLEREQARRARQQARVVVKKD